MSGDTGIVVLTPKTLAEAKDLATQLSVANTIPAALKKSPADILAIVMAGAELGLAPMQSIRALVLIQGRPTLSSEAQVALVRRQRDVCEYFVMRHSDAARATYETKRVGDPASTTMSFTIEEAAKAGLAGSDSYRKYPAAMLRARCGSALAKAVYSDLLLGVYDPEELGAVVDVTPAHVETPAAIMAGAVAPPPASPPPLNREPGDDIEDAALVTPEAGEPTPVEKCLAWISEAQTAKDLEKIVPRITLLSKDEQVSVRVPYTARRKELMAVAK